MNRRDFVTSGIAAGAGALGGLLSTNDAFGKSTADSSDGLPQSGDFTLKYAPEFGMFTEHAGEDPVDEMRFGREQGFTAWEDTGLRSRPVEEQERISRAAQDLGLDFGEFVGHMTFEEVTFAGEDEDLRTMVLEEVEESVEVARRMQTEFVHVVLGQSHTRLAWGYQMANATELLRRCADILAPEDLTMVIEPMNHRTNHPGMFLHTVEQAYELCEAVDSPACKILYDIYHVQIEEGNLIPNIDLAWDHIGYFQVGDNPGRNEPLSGEIYYTNVFSHIHEKGFDGFFGLEHGQSLPGREGEMAVIDAYRTVDPS